MANDATAQALAPVVHENVNSQAPEQTKAPADPRDEIYAKKERQLRNMQKQFQAEKAALQAKMQEYETGYVPKSRLKEATWDVLNENGVDYNKLTEELLNQPNMNDPATRAMMNKLKALEDKQAAAERQAQESTQAAYTQALASIKNEATMLIDSDPEYETIKAEGMIDAVVDLIEQTFQTENYLMDISEAAKQVETYLVDTGTKFASYSKVQSRLKPKDVPVSTPEQSKQQQPYKAQGPKITTLTNNTSPNVPKRGGEKERIARAMAAFKGELK